VVLKKTEIKKADGKLGVLIPGLGAVSTTFIAGVMMIRKGLSKPVGSLTQMGKIRVGKGNDAKDIDIKDFINLSTFWIWNSADGIYSKTALMNQQ
jgi:myo-inositol-1-phosphate synthase